MNSRRNPVALLAEWKIRRVARVLALLMAAYSLTVHAAHTTRPDFSGIWQSADASLVVQLTADNPSLMPAAKARIEYFRKNFDVNGVDDQGRQCVIGGMPWTMSSRVPYPIEIIQTGKRIIMLFELDNLRRNIYFGLNKPPGEISPGSEGFSIGHWEKQTLVIETTMLKDSSEFSLRQHSAKARITERWQRVNDAKFGETLVIDMTIVDPEIYTRAVKAHQVLKRSPANTWLGEYACLDALWEDNIAKRKLEIEQRQLNKQEK